ncbi:hypothetical protein SteCoe_19875 [Stentor coeruleus]|uniref:Uncharacterized protein n=1 Tax=Stentor coeruleus TaxID=5963 RepID=A0A1R2BTE1_9CILI|nr:hypothetical protein SteCoe_19875 [Stentor coeruleus]
MECEDCENYPCLCEDDSIRRGILTSILEMMHEKVKKYKSIMQNRVLMIKEDIVATITEETNKFQSIINKSISRLDSFMQEIQEMEDEVVVTPEMLEAINFTIDLNLDSENIQSGFNRALSGEFIIFRELLKSKNTPPLNQNP